MILSQSKKIFVILISAILVSAVGHAEKGGSFEMAKSLYETGKYPRALDLFSQIATQAADTPTRNRAYYYQGLILFELGHYFSAYVSFRNVLLSADERQKELYEKAIKNAVSISDKLGLIDRLGKTLERLPNSLIPVSAMPHVNYSLGVYYYQLDNDAKAQSNLKSVPPDSPFYSKALVYLGIMAVQKKNYREAVLFFEKGMHAARQSKDQKAVVELARLNLARTLYTIGQYEKSVEFFSQFTSSSPHWITILLEASWPLMRAQDTTVSLGNLHTVLSPFYREDLVGEAYILRTTILFSLCKYEEMKKTLAEFFHLYTPILRNMQNETSSLGSADAFYRALVSGRGLNAGFIHSAKRDEGVRKLNEVIELLQEERRSLAKFSRNDGMRKMMAMVEEAEKSVSQELGSSLQRLHRRKLAQLMQEREQANYLKVEIITGEKELIEGQQGLPPKRVVDVETSVASAYHFWPFQGEYWEDELGTYVYTTESSCIQ